jgi:hypothetical protein
LIARRDRVIASKTPQAYPVKMRGIWALPNRGILPGSACLVCEQEH